ncbi:hypothetical protein [Orlajensenia leifsoniae]|uniref:Uncharacterized protein n=1 Tax=Orlajensenia leifsoniae TaxID=2561933 RepID=A0A4Y9QUK8_9MICO|nr:hypothetical protein [Leifsonia flava]TFV94856.1 hypothetical protein E4M00_17015 [Leifsonia flava]
MSKEENAREGAQAVVPDDEMLDVALVTPRGSTFASLLGAAAGAGLGGNNATAWGVTGGILGQRANSAAKGSYPSIVLAVSATKPNVLGLTRTGIGGWKHLHPVAHIDRNELASNRHHSGTVCVIELTDTTTGTTPEFEARNIGGLGLKDFLAELGEETNEQKRGNSE